MYEDSQLGSDAKIFEEVILKAKEKGISTSVRSLKMYKKAGSWKNDQTASQAIRSAQPIHGKNTKIVEVAKKKAVSNEPLEDPTNKFNPIAFQEKVTEVMTFLLQGASKSRILSYYQTRKEDITRADIDFLAAEAYNIYATIAPAQRETILGLNYERLNMLFQKVLNQMEKEPGKTGFLVGKAVNIMTEMNSMFGIKSINLNVNNTEGIQNKINQMSDEEKMARLIELTQKEDGSFSE